MSRKADELRVVNTDGCFSWEQFWSYFKSDKCTDSMRLWTMQHLNILDCISGAMPAVQIEILQHAPKELLDHPLVRKQLSVQVLQALCTGQVMVTTLTDKELDEFEREYKKYLKQQRK